MNADPLNEPEFTRRDFLKTSATTAVGGSLLAGAAPPAHAAERSDLIAKENAPPPRKGWRR